MGSWAGGRASRDSAVRTNETFNTGNLTAPYTSSEGGFITPEEFNAQFNFESQAMSWGRPTTTRLAVTRSYTACNVGNNPTTTYCATSKFNQDAIGVGPGQRISNGKYVMWISAKDVTAATNTWSLQVGTPAMGSSGLTACL